jgi:hypothetical protein
MPSLAPSLCLCVLSPLVCALCAAGWSFLRCDGHSGCRRIHPTLLSSQVEVDARRGVQGIIAERACRACAPCYMAACCSAQCCPMLWPLPLRRRASCFSCRISCFFCVQARLAVEAASVVLVALEGQEAWAVLPTVSGLDSCVFASQSSSLFFFLAQLGAPRTPTATPATTQTQVGALFACACHFRANSHFDLRLAAALYAAGGYPGPSGCSGSDGSNGAAGADGAVTRPNAARLRGCVLCVPGRFCVPMRIFSCAACWQSFPDLI